MAGGYVASTPLSGGFDRAPWPLAPVAVGYADLVRGHDRASPQFRRWNSRPWNPDLGPKWVCLF